MGIRHTAVIPAGPIARIWQLGRYRRSSRPQDGLDLQLAERHADALVGPAAERREPVPVPLVFVARFGEPGRIET